MGKENSWEGAVVGNIPASYMSIIIVPQQILTS